MRVGALASLLLLGAGVALAQPDQPEPAQAEQRARLQSASAQFLARVNEAAGVLDKDPTLHDLTSGERRKLVEFAVGNTLFALLHELAHGLIQEMELPVLGREEDAADSYAVLAMLKVGTEVSHEVLVQTATGWFLSAALREKAGVPLAFYEEHGLDRQRAYQIICLMVGSDTEEFGDLAGSVHMPQARQATCAGDYSNAAWSWEKLLAPHLRAPDQPMQKVKVTYGPAGDNAMIARALRTTGMMEMVAERATARYLWRHPISFEVKSCGKPDVYWDPQARKVSACYEMVAYFAQLYREVALDGSQRALDEQIK